MSPYEFRVGSVRCVAISDSTEAVASDTLVGIFPPDPAIQAGIEALPYPQLFSMNCLLIEIDGQRILVDSGQGQARPDHTPLLLPELRAIGVTPDHIDLVLITHAHMDHIGGLLTPDQQFVFPNARHLMCRLEWEHWTGPAARPLSDPYFAAFKGRMELIEPDTPIARGVRTVAAPGHTPGHMAVMIESDGEALMHMADAAHHPIQTAHPAWSPKFDFDPIQSAQSRRGLFAMAARDGFPVMAYHFGFPGLGRLSADGDAFSFTQRE